MGDRHKAPALPPLVPLSLQNQGARRVFKPYAYCNIDWTESLERYTFAPALNPCSPVILSEAKNPHSPDERFFASLRMTARMACGKE